MYVYEKVQSQLFHGKQQMTDFCSSNNLENSLLLNREVTSVQVLIFKYTHVYLLTVRFLYRKGFLWCCNQKLENLAFSSGSFKGIVSLSKHLFFVRFFSANTLSPSYNYKCLANLLLYVQLLKGPSSSKALQGEVGMDKIDCDQVGMIKGSSLEFSPVTAIIYFCLGIRWCNLKRIVMVILGHNFQVQRELQHYMAE